MSSSFERDGWDSGRSPSVSRDKWVRFAIQKMERGYTLIISDARRNASFFLSGKGYEGCPYRAAKQLVLDGLVKEAGRHPLGCQYALDPDAVARLDEPPPKTPIKGRRRFDPDPDLRPGKDHRPDRTNEEEPTDE